MTKQKVSMPIILLKKNNIIFIIKISIIIIFIKYFLKKLTVNMSNNKNIINTGVKYIHNI
jgi:hypothetical protein